MKSLLVRTLFNFLLILMFYFIGYILQINCELHIVRYFSYVFMSVFNNKMKEATISFKYDTTLVALRLKDHVKFV